MPRKRQIDPAFFSDEIMVGLPLEAAFLYFGLWCWCDDAWNIEGSAAQWNIWVLPGRGYTNQQVTEWQKALVLEKRIYHYTANGKDYYHFPYMGIHQSVQYPSKPRCPVPPDSLLREVSLITQRGLNEPVIIPSRIEENRDELNRDEQSRFELSSSGKPSIPSIEEREIIQIWFSVHGFKVMYENCVKLLSELKEKHPDIDLKGESELWAIYKLDKPLSANSNAASQIKRWMGNVKRFQSNGGTPGNRTADYYRKAAEEYAHRIVRKR